MFFIVGVALGFVFLFPFANEPQISSVFGSFCIIMAIGALFYGLILLNFNKKEGDIITSVLTPLYKFYLPILIIEILLFNTILIVFNIYPGNDISVFIVVEIMLIIWILLLVPCFKLHQFTLNGNELLVTNYYNSRKFKIYDIVKVHRFFIFFFRVKLKNTTIIMLPKITESANLFGTPKSIKRLKNAL